MSARPEMPPVLRPRDALLMLRGAGRILLAGSAAEPVSLLAAVFAEPDLWAAETLTGAFIPGVNERPLGAIARVETIFLTEGLRRGGGQIAHLPLHYSAFWQRLATPGTIGAVVMTVPPPRADGTVGFGLACDFAPAAIGAGARLVGIVNPRMPDPAGAPRLPLGRFAALVEDDAALPELPAAAPDAASRAIAGHIVGLLRPGDTLQLGLGRLQTAVLARLAEGAPASLAFHAGMIAPGVLAAPRLFPRGITAGVALGDGAFYARLAQEAEIRFAPVGWTHDHATLAALGQLVSVNSVIEVDLSGQANAEYLGGQMSGQGGLVDFLRGARASRGGRAILALPATARGGQESRIRAHLGEGVPVSVARADADLVVTEHGVADLRFASLEERALRMAAIAAPAFRDGLLAAWRARG
jgi:acyl-CoA hydrolase